MPAKTANVCLRIRHESLALCVNLQRRGIPLEKSSCFLCGKGEEDGGHLFIKCKWVKEIWRELGLEYECNQLQHIKGVHAMLDSLWELDEKKRVLIITFSWQWWNQGNKVREGELPVQATKLVRRIRCNALEYEDVYTSAKKKLSLQSWEPPDIHTIKFNLDGAFVPGSSVGEWGVIARDNAGHILVAWAGSLEHTHDAFGAEVNALAVAVTIAAELGAIRVGFETDSKLLVDAMNIRVADSSLYAAIIEDLKYQLKMWFSKFGVSACRRSANSTAHELAKIGRMCLPNNCME